MVSVNVQIMHDIHNEQRDLSSSITGLELYDHYKDDDKISRETKQLLWRSRNQSQTFFDIGMIDDEYASDETVEVEYYNEDKIDEMLDQVIAAFVMANLEYQENTALNPHHLLIAQLLKRLNSIAIDDEDGDEEYYSFETNELIIEPDISTFSFDEDQMYDLVAGLIECESVAGWLLVSHI